MENGSFVVLVPFWAIWPYEVMLLPKAHLTNIVDMNDAVRLDLADALKRTTTRYDNLFLTSFPYSMGIHQRPTDGKEHPEWHIHLHFYPVLLVPQPCRNSWWAMKCSPCLSGTLRPNMRRKNWRD